MTNVISVARDFSVAPQISAADIAAAAARGVRTIINNRPDGEAPEEMQDAEARAAAKAAGVEYRAIPVTMPIPLAAVDAFAAALRETPGPHLAYCRSGTRSITLWAMAQAKGGADPDALIQTAAAAGYDLGPMRSVLSALREG